MDFNLFFFLPSLLPLSIMAVQFKIDMQYFFYDCRGLYSLVFFTTFLYCFEFTLEVLFLILYISRLISWIFSFNLLNCQVEIF